ncbi:MAG: YceI family protein [Chloroflexi bacterium]|nr:YceI family protein [Chloroflexota bacterium]
MSNDNRRGIPYLLVLLLLLIAVGGGAAAGILGYIWITGGSGEASLSVEDALATLEASEDTVADAVGTAIVDVANTVIADAVAVAVAEAVDTSVAAAVDSSVAAAMEALAPESEPIEFSIVAEESLASFTLEEDLRGVRTTVIGSTNELGGRVTVDLADPSASVIGTILVNARTLETDNSFRNRALRSQILKSAQDEFEFIIFEPRELSNFSADAVGLGETISFDISGDLTVAGETRGVTFKASVTLDSETQISGSASVNLLHADFGLVIPDVPSVANITDDVDLRLEFVARAG